MESSIDLVEIMKLFLTGMPGVGKSAVLIRTVELLKARGLKVGGFVTPELRVEGKRIGFTVKDILSGNEIAFASVDEVGRRLGKYKVNVKKFNSVALPAVEKALRECDVIAIDEIGRMELFSREFEKLLEQVLKSPKPLIATLHRKLRRRFEGKGKVIEVTLANRNELPKQIATMLETNKPY